MEAALRLGPGHPWQASTDEWSTVQRYRDYAGGVSRAQRRGRGLGALRRLRFGVRPGAAGFTRISRRRKAKEGCPGPTGASGTRRHLKTTRAGVPGDQREARGRSRLAYGWAGGRASYPAIRAARGSGVCFVDRLRECREPAAGTFRGAPPGNCDPDGARSRARPDIPTTGHGKYPAQFDRLGFWPAPGGMVGATPEQGESDYAADLR